MRLSSTTLVVLATILLASGTAVSKAAEAGVSNVDVVHPSDLLAGEGKRLLRSHLDEDRLPNYDEEERGSLFAENVLSEVKANVIYRFKMFTRWKTNKYLPKEIKNDIPMSLYKAYKIHYRKN